MANAQGSRRKRREEARAARQEAEQREAAQSARRRRLLQLGALVGIAAIVVVVAIVISSGGTSTPKKQSGEAIAGQTLAAQEFGGIPQSGNALGDPKAPHTLVEYGDLVCPACKAYSDDILPPIIEKYVRSHKLRIEFDAFGFVRPWSQPAAQYSYASGLQDKSWNFDRIWYINQGDESDNYVNDAFARKIAAGVPGLDADKLIADSRTAAAKDAVAKAQGEFQSFGFDATPSFAGGTTGGTMKPVDLSQNPDQAISSLIAGKSSGD
ncbi:DsbA family protein [Candidatus Solirubrobacter pratensis]|uniref:DsbA family protein n=1 Tax=Candidatus Solirubrobacter pratensis TaxID=1298857 RepID=UPI00041CC925|nr:thioredoxin domain-containing protein [Candidatus Solirubrobacter pratensis]